MFSQNISGVTNARKLRTLCETTPCQEHVQICLPLFSKQFAGHYLLYLIPSIVNEVAAMFVATTTFRTEGSEGSNTFLCRSNEKKNNKILAVEFGINIIDSAHVNVKLTEIMKCSDNDSILLDLSS